MDPLLSGDKVYVGCNNLDRSSLRTNKASSTHISWPGLSSSVLKQPCTNIKHKLLSCSKYELKLNPLAQILYSRFLNKKKKIVYNAQTGNLTHRSREKHLLDQVLSTIVQYFDRGNLHYWYPMAIYPFLWERERRDKRRRGNASLKAITKNWSF